LRLALILLDNAVEVMMHRAVGDELEHASFYSRLLERLPPGPLDADGEWMRSEFSAHVVPDKQARKVRRFFGEKLTFLATDRDRISRPVARVLRHIHDYRNETQHQDRVRVGSLRPATLILFDIATELLVTLNPGSVTWYSEDDYGWPTAGAQRRQRGEGPLGVLDAQLVENSALARAGGDSRRSRGVAELDCLQYDAWITGSEGRVLDDER
jgi:hypothetical protein